MYPKDSFHNKMKKKTKIDSQPKLYDFNKTNYKEKTHREIIKINYPNMPKYNYYINLAQKNNKSSNSVNKYRVNNNIQMDDYKIINSYISNEYPAPTLKIANPYSSFNNLKRNKKRKKKI